LKLKSTIIMQTGKLILSAAALVATAAGSLAFKTANKFTQGHRLFVQVTLAGVNQKCVTCRSVRTKVSGIANASSCATLTGGVKVGARNGKTYFTNFTTAKVNCLTPWTKIQFSN
jgi:hypothetical protein